jgi:phosphatidyl-myo-inositol dimannoside synthase
MTMDAWAREGLLHGPDPVVAPTRAGGQPGPVLLLAPSRGLGGGIERYVQTVQAAFDDQGVACQRLDQARPGPAGHWALLGAAAATLTASPGPVRLVVAHPALLPVAALLARTRRVRGISVVCHGADVWGPRSTSRWQLQRWLMCRRDVRIIAVSSYTAGTLLPRGLLPGSRATILPPGLSRSWFGELVSASAAGTTGKHAGLELMTAFRLGHWHDKGLPQLVAAVSALGREDARLTVCGSGEPPTDLLGYVGDYPWCTVRAGLSDRELAAQYAASDVFVLATRTRSGHRPCGEGFGLVLLEAQVAGTAVIGPAHGGSPDAYLDGISGAAPRDETVAALAALLRELTSEPGRLRRMGTRGAAWTQTRFAPDRYAALVTERLL